MKIQIIDSSASNQARYAEKLHSLSTKDVETLDLHVMLVDETNYQDNLQIMDLVILGSGLKNKSLEVAKKIKDLHPEKHIILCVDRNEYNGQIMRQAHFIGIRRVMYDMVEDLEFLQELYAIDSEFRRTGQLDFGKVITLTSPKGGAGTTSLAAAFAEMASTENKKSLLIDLDYTTQDLSRSLTLYGAKKTAFETWMDNIDSLTLKSLNEQLEHVDDNVDLFCAPIDFKTGHDLAYHPEGVAVLAKIIDLAKYNYNNIIVDLAEPNTPGAEMIIANSDEVCVLTGECPLSLSACALFIEKSKEYLPSIDNIRIVNAGNKHSTEELRSTFSDMNLNEKNWIKHLPTVYEAAAWPGSGQTIYSMSEGDNKRQLEELAVLLQVMDRVTAVKAIEYNAVASAKLIAAPIVKTVKDILSGTLEKTEDSDQKLITQSAGTTN